MNRKSLIRAIAGMMVAMPLVVAPAIASTPNSWVRVVTDKRGVWYVDRNSITNQGGYRFFWAYAIPKQKPSGLQLESGAYYVAADCQRNQYRLRYHQFLDKNFKVIQSNDFGDTAPLTKADTGSGEAASLRYVCSQ